MSDENKRELEWFKLADWDWKSLTVDPKSLNRSCPKCSYENSGSAIFCVKCGERLDNNADVIIKKNYKVGFWEEKIVKMTKKEFEALIDRPNISKDNYNSLLVRPNVTREEYERIKKIANLSWYQKLVETIKKWWDDTGGIIFLLLAFGLVICGAIWLTIGSIVSSCSSNIKIEQRDGLWGVTRGKDVVIPFECDSIISDKYDTKYSRIYKDGHVGLINNTSGKTIVPCIYLEVGEPDNVSFRGKLIAVKKDNGKWHFVDYYGLPKGRQDQYDYANWWSTAEYGIVGTIVNGEMKYGYVDERGDEKISCKYAAASDFFEGLALVKNAKYGPWICINEDGEEQYKLKYTHGDYYRESLMAVTNDSEWTSKTLFGFVDSKGELVIGMYFTPWILDDGSIYYPRFSNGKARGRYMGENGWIDKTGHFTPKE